MTTRHRARSGGFPTRGSRRRTQWVLGPGGDDIATFDRTGFSSSASQIIGSAITPTSQEFTVVRTHGHMSLSLNTADAIRSGFNIVAGIGVATLDAFTAGSASLAIPFSDIDWPGWLWHWSGSLRTSIGALAVGDPSVNPLVVRIESKSMRRIRVNEVLFLLVSTGETANATMDVSCMTRMLLKTT